MQQLVKDKMLSIQCVTVFITVCSSLYGVAGSNIGETRWSINHDSTDGGYTNILVAIDENIDEDLSLIAGIKDLIANGSVSLFSATNGQKYIKNVKILVPPGWTHQSDWNKANRETFQQARILIAPPSTNWADRPYTKQPGDCGLEGDYIHYTPQYLLGSTIESLYGPRGKTFVHEWAHLRWGLFDEYAVDFEDQKFLTIRRRLYPTQCVRNRDGIIRDRETNGGCVFDRSTGLPTDTCDFIPNDDNTYTASIMFAEYLSSVTSFCEAESLEKLETMHYTLANNRQNRLCARKSSWEVMRSHADFALDTFQYERPSVTPIFEVIHDYIDDPVLDTTTKSSTTTTTPTKPGTTTSATATTTSRPPTRKIPDLVCLALDTSGSMNVEDRIGKMGSAVANYFRNHLDTGTVVALVEYNYDASLLAPLTTITDEDSRTRLVEKIPRVANGGTGIGSGLKLCLDEFLAYDRNRTSSARIFVLSDGQENQSPSVSDVLPEILAYGVVVDTLAYSQNADSLLTNLAKETGGFSFYFSGAETSTALQDALLATVEKRRARESPVLLLGDVFAINASSSITQTVFLDKSIGKETNVVLVYSSIVEVDVKSDTNSSAKQIDDDDFQLRTLRIPGIVIGQLDVTITNPSTSQVALALIYVTSKTSGLGFDPISVSARLDSTEIQFQATTQIKVYADVYQGLSPILGVNVSGIFELAGGGELRLELLDTGTGFDTIRGDGVYTGSLLSNQLNGDGYYSLKVQVSGYGELSAGSFSGASGGSISTTLAPSTSLGSISRSTSGGTFRVENFDPDIAARDNFAPGQIKDLTLTVAIYGANNATLQWTATGDDFYNGNAARHEISVWYDTFDQAAQLLLPSAYSTPAIDDIRAESGTTVNVVIAIGKLDRSLFQVNESVELDTFYFRVRGVDDEGNAGVWSNEVPVSFVNPADYETEVVTVTTEQGMDEAAMVAIGVGTSLGIVIIIVVPTIIGCYFCNKKKNKVHDIRHQKL